MGACGGRCARASKLYQTPSQFVISPFSFRHSHGWLLPRPGVSLPILLNVKYICGGGGFRCEVMDWDGVSSNPMAWWHLASIIGLAVKRNGQDPWDHT